MYSTNGGQQFIMGAPTFLLNGYNKIRYDGSNFYVYGTSGVRTFGVTGFSSNINRTGTSTPAFYSMSDYTGYSTHVKHVLPTLQENQLNPGDNLTWITPEVEDENMHNYIVNFDFQ